MKTLQIRLLTAAVLLMASSWATAQFEPTEPAQPAPGGGLPEVVATVAGEPIPRETFMQAVQATTRRLVATPQAQQQGITQLNPDQLRQVLDSIIANRIALHLAKEAGVEVSEDAVDEFLEREMARFPSEEVFQNFLQNEGLTLEIMRERTREMIRLQNFTETITSDIEVTEEEVREQYDSMRDEGRLNAPKTWDFRHILIKADPADPESLAEAEAKAHAVRARIAEGEDFAALAEELSDDLNSRENGGLYRNVPRGRGLFDETFEEEALAVRAGELSEPFETRMGWHLVSMEAVHEAGLMSYDRVSDSLENQLLVRKQQVAFQEELAGKRDQVPVEVFINFGGGPAPQQQPGGSAIDDLLRQLDDGS